MSLHEAYELAHTAQCKLNFEATRPNKNLRFVVGHLMHYESLRLRIVDIHHDNSQRHGAKGIKSQTEHRLPNLKQKNSPPLAAPSPSQPEYGTDDDFCEDLFDDDYGEDLSLSRFPSGSSRPPRTPDLEPDLSEDDSDSNDDDERENELLSPDDLIPQLRGLVNRDSDDLLSSMYEGVRECPCQGETDALQFESMWELPSNDRSARKGATRAIGKVMGAIEDR